MHFKERVVKRVAQIMIMFWRLLQFAHALGGMEHMTHCSRLWAMLWKIPAYTTHGRIFSQGLHFEVTLSSAHAAKAKWRSSGNVKSQ